MNYNPDMHKRRSIRLKGYDYSQAGLYFITICIHDRACLFGKVIDNQMALNIAGHVANDCWLQIPKHFPNALLHEYIIMPNHVHGILELVGHVGAENFLPLQHNEFQKMIPHSIGSMVKGFKIGVTKWFRNDKTMNFPPDRPLWQRNYYEHIIRNEIAHQNISNYIINNPANWKEDSFYS